MKKTEKQTIGIKYINTLRFLNEYFRKNSLDWMVVSGVSVFYYGNPQRPITDIDIIVNGVELNELEYILNKNKEFDGLCQVKFVSKFGDVTPITSYLRTSVRGVEVHISTDWVYKLNNGRIIRMPYNEKAIRDAILFKIDGFRIKIARPELVFICKSITRRTFRVGSRIINKDLVDCGQLKNNHTFSNDYLKELLEQNGLSDLYSKIVNSAN
ncbi:MAG: hypothetical protein M1352_00130 [Patescibacteria group bacterium]|nr:hypothetical protein [Patescibacteria group bacterium]